MSPYGPAGQLAGGGDGQGLDAGQDLAARRGVGGGPQLPGEQGGLLGEQGPQGRLGVGGGAPGQGGPSRAWVPPEYRQQAKTTTNDSCTLSGVDVPPCLPDNPQQTHPSSHG